MTAIPPKFKQKEEVPLHRKAKNGRTLLIVGFALVALLFAAYKGRDFLRVNKDGEVVLSAERLDKLQRELDDIDDAVQYSLRATKAGYYPCLNCIDSSLVYLDIGEIWKYGVTSKGELIRYGKALAGDNLYYHIEFTGDYAACLKQEKSKIYNYALLPENLKRMKPLIRPPGNKIDK